MHSRQCQEPPQHPDLPALVGRADAPDGPSRSTRQMSGYLPTELEPASVMGSENQFINVNQRYLET